MATLRFTLVHVLLCLFHRVGSTPALLAKRDVIKHCTNGFNSMLQAGIQDAATIMTNMVAHLNLAINMFDADGELLDGKDEDSRTFDEQNAFMSYQAFIGETYFGPGSGSNQPGLEKMAGTLKIAQAVEKQFTQYLQGSTGGTTPWLYILCTDEDILSATDEEGRTFTEAYPDAENPFTDVDGTTKYWLSQRLLQSGGRAWVTRRAVCDLGDGQTTRFLNPQVPVKSDLGAYVTNAFGNTHVEEEYMVLCPAHQAEFTAWDAEMTNDHLHYRDLHVDIGGSVSDDQQEDADALIATGWNIAYLTKFLARILIHESTHSKAFLNVNGDDLTPLEDIPCTDDEDGYADEGNFVASTYDPECLWYVARGENGRDEDGYAQGHLDAEAFAKYAMAVYVNAVAWYQDYMPRDRGTV